MRHNGRLEKRRRASISQSAPLPTHTHTSAHTTGLDTLLISHTGLQPGLITLLFRKDSCRRWISSFREKLWSVYAGCRCRWPTSAVDKLALFCASSGVHFSFLLLLSLISPHRVRLLSGINSAVIIIPPELAWTFISLLASRSHSLTLTLDSWQSELYKHWGADHFVRVWCLTMHY